MIVSVASGKGGTGKTLVATSFALALSTKHQVRLLDCDVEEPNSHIFLKPRIKESRAVTVPVPTIDEDRCNHMGKCADICAYHALAITDKSATVFPELCHGCGACAFLCPEKAITEVNRQIGIVEEGNTNGLGFIGGRLSIGQPMSPPVIKEVKKCIGTNGVITVIDAPPGTSCPAIESIRNSHFCILVTEPTPFGFNDLVLAVDMVKKVDIPTAVIVNKDGIGNDKVEVYCRENGIPILLKIPFSKKTAGLYSRGITLSQGQTEWQPIFLKLYQDIQRILDE